MIGWRRLVEHYEGRRYRRTYGRNADHSRALAAARDAMRCPDCEQDCSRAENHAIDCPWPTDQVAAIARRVTVQDDELMRRLDEGSA